MYNLIGNGEVWGMEPQIHIKDLYYLFMNQMKIIYDKRERINLIKKYILTLIKRKQVLDDLFVDFESAFKFSLKTSVKRYLLDLKDCYDNNLDVDSEKLEQISIIVLQNSPLCDNTIIHTPFPEKAEYEINRFLQQQ